MRSKAPIAKAEENPGLWHSPDNGRWAGKKVSFGVRTAAYSAESHFDKSELLAVLLWQSEHGCLLVLFLKQRSHLLCFLFLSLATCSRLLEGNTGACARHTEPHMQQTHSIQSVSFSRNTSAQTGNLTPPRLRTLHWTCLDWLHSVCLGASDSFNL